ncbi:MAG: hypothetical protein EOP38_14670 [Rubrivivax sp.]|nr:MAG: hypothetical protein EOP38_14670 [Rubrivivax sp.]
MKSPAHPVLAALLAGGALLSTALPTFAAPQAALEISIGGIGPGVDATAFKKVKLLLAEALYSGTIDYFDVLGYGKEGGFSACVEQGQFAVAGSFDRLARQLKQIKPNPNTTAYSVEAVAQCTYPVADPAQ